MKITLGTKDYDLLLTMKGMKAIYERFGDMNNVPDALAGGKAIDHTIFLITLLINGAIEYRNLDSEEKKALLTEDEVSIRMSVSDLAKNQTIIYRALAEGLGRDVKPEETIGKNAVSG